VNSEAHLYYIYVIAPTETSSSAGDYASRVTAINHPCSSQPSYSAGVSCMRANLSHKEPNVCIYRADSCRYNDDDDDD